MFKRNSIIALIALSISHLAQADLNAGLVAYYPFNTNALDASGNGNDGIVYGATLTADRFGNANSAYSFNGINNHIDTNLPTIDTTTTHQNTVAFWMYWNGIESTAGKIPLGFDNYDLYFVQGTFGFNTGVGDVYGITSAALVNQWLHIAAVFTNGDVTQNKLYINGVAQLLSQLLTSPVARAVTPGMIIGEWIHASAHVFYFGGKIDDVRVYNRALTATEVAQLYQLEVAIAPAVNTNAPSLITSNSAILKGTVNPNGADTLVTFDFGTTATYDQSITANPSSLAANAAATSVSAGATGLTCNTLYHYRVKAVNSVDTTNGADQSFTTAACPLDLPVAVTNAATAVAATSATLNGSVTSKGATATASFDLGTSTSYSETVTATPAQIYSSTAVAMSASKAGLACNTAYNFRTKAVSSAGTGLGANQTFTTLTCPVNSWLTPPTSTVPRDLPFTLDLVVKSDGMKVSNYEFAVTLDPTKLQFDTAYQNAAQTCYLGVCPGTSALLNRNVVDTNIGAGSIVVTGQDATGQGPSNDLQLLIIHFKTKTTVGATPVNVVTNKLQNPSGGSIGLIAKGATVNVSYGLCGDADGNNAVNIVDALAVARKLVNLPPPPTIDVTLADVNKDGQISITDALHIARYSVGLLLPPGLCAIGLPL